MRHQRGRLVFVALLGVLATVRSVDGAPRAPDWAEISVQRTSFKLSWRWDGEDPGFRDDSTAEFEVRIRPKCFAQPPGGRDDSPVYRGDTNLEELGLRIYSDVWNYWQPRGNELGQLAAERCDLNSAQELGIAKLDPEFIEKDHGNFAVGVRNASELKAGPEYYFTYELEPDCAACSEDESCGETWVTMQVFDDDCHVPFGVTT